MRILIEVPSWLGDAVMATPAIENLLNFYYKSEVILIGSFVSIEALKNHPRVSNAYVVEKKYTSLYSISKKLGKFDIFLSFRGSFRAKVLKFLIFSKKKYQFDRNRYQNRHQVEKYNDFINNSLNTNFDPKKLIIHKNLKLTSKNLKPIIGINPGASYGPSKCWNPIKFIKLAAKLSQNFDIIIFGGPNEKKIAGDIEKGLIEKGVVNYQNLATKTSIEELIYHISTLDMFVTGDSGPMHLAAAFQIPTVAIFGPTNHKETSQWMNYKNVIVKKNLDCQPCMKRKCPLRHNNCMKLIQAQVVFNAVKSLS